MPRGTAVQAVAAVTAWLAFGYAAAQEKTLPVPHVDMRQRWGFLIVPVSPVDGCPLTRADAPLADLSATCSEFADKARSARTPSDRHIFADTVRKCVTGYTELYMGLLQQRYAFADFAEVLQQLEGAPDLERLECLLAASHNAHANAEIERKQAERNAAEERVNESYARSEAQLEAHRQPSKPDRPSTGKRALQALALGLQVLGQGMQRGSDGSAPPRSPSRSHGNAAAPQFLEGTGTGASDPETKSDECTSDYSCAYGFACVKAPFKMSGYCARKVNQFGTPTYSPPSPKSVMPGGNGQCGFDTQCPVGFHCAIAPGAIRGACMK